MLQLKPPLPPMEALAVNEIPTGGWQYEPKWDGFRCIAFRDGDDVYLQSKAEKPLGRYFPEIVAAVKALKPKRFVLDGEIAVPIEGRLNFDELLQRIHPAESRIRKLSTEHPAIYIVFDLLADEKGVSLLELPLEERRAKLEALAKHFDGAVRLSPATTKLSQAKRWFESVGGNLDGVIAKVLDCPYRSGDRTGMQKIKNIRTADCVVGGFRYGKNSKLVGSLLLGLYDAEGLLHHVGFTSTIRAADKAAITKKLEKLIEAPGFTGSAPGGPSRWSTERSTEWQPLRNEFVVEVAFDHFTTGRFRHGTSLHRWRPDKSPEQCTFEQVASHAGADLSLLEA